MKVIKDKQNSSKRGNKSKRIILYAYTIIMLLLAILLYILCEKFDEYYFIFLLIFGITPFGFFNLDLMLKEQGLKINKYITIKKITLFLFYDICFIVIAKGGYIFKFIFGISAIVFILVNLGNAFINQVNNNTTFNYFILLELILAIGITIYLISIIKQKNIRDITTAIVSATYGGLLTLVGVLLTIRRSEKNIKNENILQNKPMIFLVNQLTNNVDNAINVQLLNNYYSKEKFNKGQEYLIKQFYIQNGDFSYSSIKGIAINNDIQLVEIAQCLKKEQCYKLKFINNKFKYEEEIKNISLIVVDMLENYYIVNTNFKYCYRFNNVIYIEILSFIDQEIIKIDFNNYKILK